MPSLRAYLGISLAALLQLSVAAPMPATLVPAAQRDARCFPVLPAATPSLPVNGGGTELPAPVNVTLKYVAIGRGIQNYTCSAVNATPVALGAIATLFDGTLYASTNPTDFDTIPATVVYQPVPADVLTSGSNSFPLLGHHYFDSTGTPTFDLSTVSDLLVGKKTADIKAPSTANVGPGGTGAVDWLQLQDKGGSIGVTEVYRVVTAGGNANATCTSTGVMSIQYAAQYWFYG